MTQEDEYKPFAKWLHWFVALLVFVLVPVGLVMTRLGPGETQDRLFILHESFGVTLLGLMVLRVVNRLRNAPPPPAGLSQTERRLSLLVHRTLYALLFATPIIGWFALSAFGLGPSFFGIAELPALVAKNEDLAKRLFKLHLLGGLSIAGLVLFHIAAALRHARNGDRVLARMAFFGARK